jgi:hypothetical protein
MEQRNIKVLACNQFINYHNIWFFHSPCIKVAQGLVKIMQEFQKKCIGQMLLTQGPSTTEARSHGVFPCFSQCFRVSVVQESVQSVFDQDRIPEKEWDGKK